MNVSKHAGTNAATVRLRPAAGKLSVTVEDQGRGFDPGLQIQLVGDGHFGLFSVRERMEHMGGAFDLQSAPEKGTRVTLTVATVPAA